MSCHSSKAVLVFLMAGTVLGAEPEGRDRFGDPLPKGAVLRLGTVRFRGSSYGVLSPDGKTWAAAVNRQVHLFDVQSGQFIRSFDADQLGMQRLAFTPDGKKLVTGGYSGIQIYDVKNGQSLQTIKQRAVSRGTVEVSPDGRVIVATEDTYNNEGKVHLFDIENGKELATYQIAQNVNIRAALSPDGKVMATGGQVSSGARELSQVIQLWDVEKGKELRQLKLDSNGATAMAFAPDGKTLALSSGDATLSLWDVATGKEKRRSAGRRGQGAFLTFAPDGKTLLSAGHDGAVQIWDPTDGKRLGVHEGPTCRFGGLVHINNQKIIAWGADAQAVIFWDVLSGKILNPQEGHHARVQAVTFLDRDRQLVSVDYTGQVIFWDRATGKPARSVQLQQPDRYRGASFSGCGFAPDGRYLVAGRDYATLIYELPDMKEVCSLPGARMISRMHVPAFSRTPGRVAVPSHTRKAAVGVWDLDTGQGLLDVELERVDELALALTPDSKKLAVCRQHRGANLRQSTEVRLWDVDDEKKSKSWDMPEPAQALTFTPDGLALLMATRNSVRMVDAATGQLLRAFTGLEGYVNSPLVLSPDGRLLAVGTANGQHSKLQVFELLSGSVRCQFDADQGQILDLAFSADGRYLASAGADTTVLIWDLEGLHDVKSGKLAAADLDRHWGTLRSTSGVDAFRAVRELAAAPADTVPFLDKQLQADKGDQLGEAAIQRLIVQLDDDSFEVRTQATQDLQEAGKQAQVALEKALTAKPSAEARRRIEQLLDRLKQPAAAVPESLRPRRACEVLERIGSLEAQAILKRLATGRPDSPLTRDASDALKRLANKP